VLYAPEGNRLRRIDLASADRPPLRQDVLIERAARDPARGRDVNGMVCALPDGNGGFVAGEDTGQPDAPAGWGVFSGDGTQLAKLVATSLAEKPDPYGCAFDAQGRLFTTEIGDPGFGAGNGQLLLWLPEFARGAPDLPARACKLATDLGTATGIAVDPGGRIYVAASSGFRIERFSPPFPTAADAAGGCGGRDATGAPRADRVQRDTFVWARPQDGLLTYSGLAFAPNGNLYAASVATGRIGEFAPDGSFVRLVLAPSGWLPPFDGGAPQGLAVDAAGTLYYADLDLRFEGWRLRPGSNGTLRRIRFAGGIPQAPDLLLRGLEYPDGLGILPGSLAPARPR
jgi:DNA-binding beta-propeller fold protein YncE